VNDAQLMQVLNAAYDLLEETASFNFLELLFLNDVVKKFSSADILHDQKELLGCLDNFEELDDVGVSDHFKDVDLACNPLHVCVFNDLALLEDLDCHLIQSSLCGLPFLR
jgi:hypothetical protein